MKKLLALFVVIFSTLSCFAGCDFLTEYSSCEHTYKWVTSKNSHQKVYTCSCPTPDILEPHFNTDENYVCDICGYEMEKPVSASLGLEYVKNNDGTKYAVKSIGICTDKDIVIPSTHEGLPVDAVLYEAFAQNKEIKSVVLPDSIVSIYNYAFSDCVALESVEFGKGLKNVWEGAFAGCEKLSRINLPEGLENIYKVAFAGCLSLREVVLPNSVKTLENFVFGGCTSLRAISFSEGMEIIPEGVCYDCFSLETINFGKYVTTVREYAFYNCYALQELYIPTNLTYLGRDSFRNCGLTKVEFEIKENWLKGNSKVDVTNAEKNAEKFKQDYYGNVWRREV